jgi:hypothetical protein
MVLQCRGGEGGGLPESTTTTLGLVPTSLPLLSSRYRAAESVMKNIA